MARIRRIFALEEERVFYIVSFFCFIALFFPIEFSKRNRQIDLILFKKNYHLWAKWLIVVALALLAIVAFYLAFRILKQYFIINNNPVSKIRSAAQGYVEVEGIQAFLPGKSLQAPISKSDCTWYWYRIEELRQDYRGRSYWHEKESGESKEHFMLVDTTGQCIICPEGADVFTTTYKVWIDKDNPKFKYTEHLLIPNKYVYITGVFRTLDSSSQDSELIEKHKEVSELIKKWKQDYADLLQKFDKDHDQQLDKDEWENVIKSAEQQISSQYPNTAKYRFRGCCFKRSATSEYYF